MRQSGRSSVFVSTTAVGTLLLGSAGCGVSGAQSDCDSVEHIGEFSWERPLYGDSMAISIEAAKRKLPFQPIIPTNLGQPENVFVSTVDRTWKQLAFVYRSGSAGFDLVEARGTGEAHVERAYRTASCVDPDFGAFSNEVRWVWVAGDATSFLIWYPRPRLELTLVGSGTTLSQEAALRIAREINAL